MIGEVKQTKKFPGKYIPKRNPAVKRKKIKINFHPSFFTVRLDDPCGALPT